MTGRTLLTVAIVGAAVVIAGCSGPSRAATPNTSPTHAAVALTSPVPVQDATTGSPAITLQQAFVQVVKNVNPSVVQIETDQGLGSGVIFDAGGDIVTNYHVVQGGRTFRVTLSDGKQYPASLVGTFAADDLAVVKISAPSIHPASFGDSSKLEVGDIVLAIGNPLGFQSSVTEGIVSAVGRTVDEGNGTTLPNVIQSSAAINPGNSGGALVDLNGMVIGIPTLGVIDQQLGGSAPGIGFAISSATFVDIANQLIQNGKVTNSHRAYIGVRVGNARGVGVYISAVTAGGPADKAGIKAGDIVTSIDGKATADTIALSDVLASMQPGQTVKVNINRANGSTATVNVTLGQLPG